MRKFKHEKTGIIGEVKEYHLYFDRCHGDVCSQETISMELIEGSKDWIEVIQPKYEIIGFTDGHNDYFKLDNGFFTINTVHCYSSEVLLNRSDVKIKKVKRVSDGKIFRLGDQIKHSSIKIPSAIIENFYINKENNCLAHSKDAIFSEVLDKIELDNCLFKTVDGVDIHHRDTFFIVNKFYKVQQSVGGHFQSSKWEKYRFSTKEMAERYALTHKPCISLMDFQTAFNNIGYCNSDQGDRICDLADELKKIVAERI